MKLSLALLLGATAAEAATTFGQNKQPVDGAMLKKLMANAKPYGDHAGHTRKLDGDYALTGANSVVFNSCKSLIVDSSLDNVAAEVAELVEGGKAQAVGSYVLFDICETNNCSRTKVTYLTSLSSYMMALMEYFPYKMETYCQGCEDNRDYCNIFSPENEDGHQLASGGQRCEKDGIVYEAIDCQRCYHYGCMMQSDYYVAQREYKLGQSDAWMQGMSTCYQSQRYGAFEWEGIATSLAFTCNAAGNGVEIGVFLDDQCTIQTNQLSYNRFITDLDYYYYHQTKGFIQAMFNYEYTCYDPYVEYVNPVNFDFSDDCYKEGYQGTDELYSSQAGNWCSAVFQQQTSPIEYDGCGDNDNGAVEDYSYNGAADGEDYYYNGAADGDGRRLDGGLTENNAGNMYSVCSVLENKRGRGDQPYSAGSMYSYSGAGSQGKLTSQNWEGKYDGILKDVENSGRKKHAWIGVILVCLLLGGAGAGGYYYMKQKDEQAVESFCESLSAPLLSLQQKLLKKSDEPLLGEDDKVDVPLPGAPTMGDKPEETEKEGSAEEGKATGVLA